MPAEVFDLGWPLAAVALTATSDATIRQTTAIDLGARMHRSFPPFPSIASPFAGRSNLNRPRCMSMAVDVDYELPATLKAVAEPLRWQILTALAREELCVCHLTEDLGVAQPLISHHLRVLRDAGLVESEKGRYWTYYRLPPTAVRQLGERLIALAASAPSRASNRRPCC